MDDLSLDFISRCLQIDPILRWDTKELLNHPLFDDDFKIFIADKMDQWRIEDDSSLQELMQEMNGESPESIKGDSPVRRDYNLPEEFTNVNEMLAILEQRKSINEGNSLRNAGSIEYSV